MTITRLLIVAIAGGLLVAGADGQTARYRVRFNATWSAATHPSAFPANAHFSPLIGASHNDQVTFWEVGGLATAGIESMAETGATGTLSAEITTARNAGNALDTINGSGLNPVPDATLTSFDVTAAHPRVSLVTMIAPSPDWFVGVTGVELHAAGVFQDNIVIDLYAYDSGTDSGATFTAANNNTNPADPIRSIADESPFAGTPALGTFTFILLELPCPGDTDGDSDVDLTDLARLLAGFGQTSGAFVADGDVNNDRAVDITDLAILLANYAAPCFPD